MLHEEEVFLVQIGGCLALFDATLIVVLVGQEHRLLEVSLGRRVDRVHSLLRATSFLLHLDLARAELFILALVLNDTGAFRSETSRRLNHERLLSPTDSQVLTSTIPLYEVLRNYHFLLGIFLIGVNGSLAGMVLQAQITKLLRVVQRLRRFTVLALGSELLRDFFATRPFLNSFLILH